MRKTLALFALALGLAPAAEAQIIDVYENGSLLSSYTNSETKKYKVVVRENAADFSAFYTLNYPKTSAATRSDRYTNTIVFTTPTDGAQSFDTKQSTDKVFFVDQTDKCFKAKAGETVTFGGGYNAGWMHTYVYVDFGDDGQFAYTVNSDGTPADGSDLFSYSYYDGKNSQGSSAGQGNSVTPPATALPSGLGNGFYRVRYKVDWDDLDPGGSTSQSPIQNGGIIFDTRLNVHGDNVSVSATSPHGSVTGASGASLDGTSAPFGEALAIKFAPADNYRFVSALIKHGYNLSGPRQNTYGTIQYDTLTVTSDSLADGVYTLPAGLVDGDVSIEATFAMDPSAHEMVDLGLPSGLLWATCNVGASTPYEDGDYFAWGETEPKSDYTWSNYKLCNGSYNTLTKYCNTSSLGYNGFTDDKTVLDAEDDVATAKWGAGYRMPTYAEFTELNNYCTWTWNSTHNGYTVTGTNGKSIFLPASGYRDGSSLYDHGSYGSYWSATLGSGYANDAYSLDFYSGNHNPNSNGYRCIGLSVRPVAEP